MHIHIDAYYVTYMQTHGDTQIHVHTQTHIYTNTHSPRMYRNGNVREEEVLKWW